MFSPSHPAQRNRVAPRLVALAFAFFLTASAYAQAVLGPGLDATLAGLAPGEAIEVVISFDGENPITADQLAAVQALGVTQALHFETLPIMGALVTADQAAALAARSDVRSIWPNEEVTFYNKDGRDITGVNKLRNDSNLRTAMGLPYSGKGVGVVVNDSGIDGTLPDLEYGRYVVENVQAAFNLHAVSDLMPYTFIEGQENTDTGSGHGTHVAGTVGGRGVSSGGVYEGVAPGADIIGYGSGTAALLILDGIGGFEWAITHQFEHNIRIITNSWGSSGDFNPNHPINIASYLTYKRGITVLFAAGNSGPGENTHNPYSAPWTISVGAGVKDGTLADFSSRGKKGQTMTFTMYDGQEWTYNNEPDVVAPGVDIISSRATTGALPALAAEADIANLGTNAAFYTTMSGTSMATPHVAGIAALLIEAVPTLSPAEVKHLVKNSATNMPGREDWEAGAGYVNAYNAIVEALGLRTDFGSLRNDQRAFACEVDITETSGGTFSIDYNPEPLLSADGNETTIDVPAGLSQLVVTFLAEGIAGESGNPIYPVVIAPDGTSYSSGTTLLFAIDYRRTQTVDNPMPGTWTIRIQGIQNGTGRNVVSVPEQVDGDIFFKTVNGFTGLTDIDGHAAQGSIEMAVTEHLADCDAAGTFRPNATITRAEMADFLVMGAGIRQSLPLGGGFSATDVDASFAPFAEAVTAMGAALKNAEQFDAGVMTLDNGAFNPSGTVSRLDVAYALVQSLGLQDAAQSFSGEVMAQHEGGLVVLEDSDAIPAAMRGYAQAAIDLGILNVYFSLEQGEFDLQPTIKAEFRPAADMTRAGYAVAAGRFFNNY